MILSVMQSVISNLDSLTASSRRRQGGACSAAAASTIIARTGTFSSPSSPHPHFFPPHFSHEFSAVATRLRLQVCQPNKTLSIRAILNHYKLTGSEPCAVLVRALQPPLVALGDLGALLRRACRERGWTISLPCCRAAVFLRPIFLLLRDRYAS